MRHTLVGDKDVIDSRHYSAILHYVSNNGKHVRRMPTMLNTDMVIKTARVRVPKRETHNQHVEVSRINHPIAVKYHPKN